MLWHIDIETADGEKILTKYCSRTFAEVLKWWNEKWADEFVADRINFSVYADKKPLTFSQAFDLGFYDKLINKGEQKNEQHHNHR